MNDRRKQILDTAAELFAERGFHGVSVHDIGAACGISGPALYNHISGTGDLAGSTFTIAGGSFTAAHVTSDQVIVLAGATSGSDV